MTDGLLPGADRDLVNILAKRITSICEAVLLNTKVASVTAAKDSVTRQFDQRLGQADIAGCLGDLDQIDKSHAQPASTFGCEHADQAHLGNGRPARLVARLAAVEQFSQIDGVQVSTSISRAAWVMVSWSSVKANCMGFTPSAGQASARQ